ncbi:uncharacterized protein [Ptychodera flava]|uniref:uncharacterized protein isoform X1 n=1 Tax=Ptychodera flava TaxID=63121 RepID=UPI00396A5A5E
MTSTAEDEYPRLLDLRSKKTYHISKRTLKIGWGDYDLVLPDEDCKGLCCEIVSKENEVILFPFSIMTPCLVNDTEVDEQTTLSHGCTIKLGKSSLYRYEQSSCLPPPISLVHVICRSNRGSVSDQGDLGVDGPPPKPKRIYNNKPQLPENAVGGARQGDPHRASYSELSDEWCVVVQPNIDTELIQQLQTPEQIAHLASSYMSRQLLMLTDMDISPQIVDKVFKALREVVDTNETLILDFLRQFCEKNNTLKEKDFNQEDDAGGESPSPELPCHGPLIKLLLDLLRFSLDPVDHNILWISLLAKLSVLEDNQMILLRNKAGAVLLGTMAAHLQSHEIQEYACIVLAQLAKYKPTPKEKGAVRQCAIELVVNAMERHLDRPNVLRPACRLLANVVHTTSEVTAMTREHEGFNVQEFDKMVVASLEMIDYIRDSALPVLESAMREYPKDFSINFDGKQVKEYFQSPSKFKQKKEMERDKAQKDAMKNIAMEAKKVKRKSDKKKKGSQLPEAGKPESGQVYIHSLRNEDKGSNGGLSPSEIQNGSELNAANNGTAVQGSVASVLDSPDREDVYTSESTEDDDHGQFDEGDSGADSTDGRQWHRVNRRQPRGRSARGEQASSPEPKKERKRWGVVNEPVIPAELVGMDNTIHSRRNMAKKDVKSHGQASVTPAASASPATTTSTSDATDAAVVPTATPTTTAATAATTTTTVQQKQRPRPKVNHSEIINFLGTLWITGNQIQAVESLTKATEEILAPPVKEQKKRDSSSPDNWLIQTDPTVCADALSVFCSHKSKWTLVAAAKVMPLTEMLFAKKILMRPAAEVVSLILSMYGQDILKHAEALEQGWPSPFNKDNRVHLDICYNELSRVHDHVDYAISRVSDSGIDSRELIKRLQALQEELLSYNALISVA